MSELVSNINRRIDSIAATEKLRMLTTEEINCQSLLKQLADRIPEQEQDKAELVEFIETETPRCKLLVCAKRLDLSPEQTVCKKCRKKLTLLGKHKPQPN